MNQQKDNLIKHGSIMLASTLIGGATHYLYHFLMIRLLSPAEYGSLYSLLALFMIVGVPVGTIAVVITKYVSKYKGVGDENRVSLLFERALKILSVLGIVIFCVFALGSTYISGYLKIDSVIPVCIIGFVLGLSFVSTVTTGTLQGLQSFFFLGSLNIVGAVAKVLFGVLFVWLAWGVNGALMGPLVASVLGLLIAFLPLKHYFHYERSEETSLDKKEISKYFVPVGIAIFCYGFLTYYDALIVKHYFSPDVAGYYATCALIGKAFLFPPAAFAGALFPKVSEMHAVGKKPYPLFRKSLWINIMVLIIGALVCVLFPKIILDLLLHGKQVSYAYDKLILLMRIFGIMVAPYGLLNLVIYYNLAMHRTGFLYLLVGGGLLLVVSLLLFHATLLQVVLIFGAIGYLLFIAGVVMIRYTKEVEGEGVSGEDLYINAGI